MFFLIDYLKARTRFSDVKELPAVTERRRRTHYLNTGDYYTNQHEYALAAHMKNILNEVVSSKLGWFSDVLSKVNHWQRIILFQASY